MARYRRGSAGTHFGRFLEATGCQNASIRMEIIVKNLDEILAFCESAARPSYTSEIKSIRTGCHKLQDSVYLWDRRKRAIDKQRDVASAGLRAVLDREPTDAELDKYLEARK